MLVLSRNLLFAIAMLWGACCLSAQTAPYKVTPGEDSRFELTVEKTGLMSGKKHLFQFPDFQGQLEFDAETPARSSILLHITTASVECKDDWVSAKDLKKIEAEARDKMLDAANHKEMVFRSTSMTKQSDGSYEVEGTLQIRNIEKPVSVAVTVMTAPGGALRFTGESVLDMTEWGLKPPSAALGTVGTNKLMRVYFELSARQR